MVTGDDLSRVAQALWRHVEAYHAVVYFAPEHRQACDGIGLKGGWMAYFASRAAPLGAVPGSVVTALFHNFHPAMVARAIPDAWGFAAPDRVLAARYSGMDAALRRVLDGAAAGEEVRRAGELTRAAAAGADLAGRPLFAANLALDWPQDPHLLLWHAATLLREHRGDGHVATLTAEGISGCQAHVLQVAAGAFTRALIQPVRGWSDQDWDEAVAALTDRGWLDDGGTLTARGQQVREHVQERTDRLAAAPLRALGEEATRQLLDALRPLSALAREAGGIPYPNPMAVPEP